MRALAAVGGFLLLAVVLWDAFETVVLPRRVTRRVRLTSLFYRATWAPFAACRGLLSERRREAYLSFYGPLSLVLLLGLWAAGLVVAVALLHYAAGSRLHVPGEAFREGFATDLYFSATTLFTLGLGDVAPASTVARALAAVEAGMGFAFLALVIGYFPVIYQVFSRREANISLLDARAGSPPSAAELLRRHRGPGGVEALERILREWERWAAELLESHLSYPVLGYFRSQHKNESWLAALTAILDTCALLTVAGAACERQARLTFAIARHALVDLAQVFDTPPAGAGDRLTAAMLGRLRTELAAVGVAVAEDSAMDAKLQELRRMYEPYAAALSRYLLHPLPPWCPETDPRDNWQTSAWEPATPPLEEHF